MEMEAVVARLPEDCVLLGYDCIATTRLCRHDMLNIETCPEVAYAIWNVFVGDLLLSTMAVLLAHSMYCVILLEYRLRRYN